MPFKSSGNQIKNLTIILGIVLILVVIAGMLNVSSKTSDSSDSKPNYVHIVTSPEEMKEILEDSTDKIMVFDFYADWCMPCRILSPILKEIAKEYHSKAIFYKVNVDDNPKIANAFGAMGIPYVVMVHNGEILTALSGVQPRENYVNAINSAEGLEASDPEEPANKKAPAPSGSLISAQQAMALIQDFQPLILDVRTPGEFSSGHIKNAVLIPLRDLPQKGPEKLAGMQDKKILVYCRSGNRSQSAVAFLSKNGFQKLYELQSGLIGWKSKNYPLVK